MNDENRNSYDDLKRKRRMSKISWAFTYSIIAGLFVAVIVFTLLNRADYFIESKDINGHIVKLVLRVDGDNRTAGEEALAHFESTISKYAYSLGNPVEMLNQRKTLNRDEDEQTFNLIREIIDYAKLTEGLFDPTFSKEGCAVSDPDEILFKNGYYKIYADEYEIRLEEGVEMSIKDLIPYYAMDKTLDFIKMNYKNISGYIQYDEDFLIFGRKFNASDWTIPILQPDKELTYSDETMILLYVPEGAVIRKAEPLLSPVDGTVATPDFYSVSLISANALRSKCILKAVQVSPTEYARTKSAEWECEFMVMNSPEEHIFTTGFGKYLINK